MFFFCFGFFDDPDDVYTSKDIIIFCFWFIYSNCGVCCISVTEAELERLKHALKILSEAEKQLRVSSERSTWFTATLLQLGSVPSPDLSHSCSRRHSCKTTEDDSSSASTSREAATYKQKLDGHYMLQKSTHHASVQKAPIDNSNHQGDLSSRNNGFGINTKPSHDQFRDSGASTPFCEKVMAGNMILRCVNSGKLEDVWAQCIERCHSKTLRQLLHSHGKLVSISEAEAEGKLLSSSCTLFIFPYTQCTKCYSPSYSQKLLQWFCVNRAAYM